MSPFGSGGEEAGGGSPSLSWRKIADLRENLLAGLIGGEILVERMLAALLAGGHLLVEGAPGLAKTRAVKLLARGLDLPFARVQCTPDLMPADITGTAAWRPDKGVFEFLPGPIFHSLLLVDEINRAPPKVQSALLEGMAERQATVAGITHPLPDPFLVVATQNPIEHEGTYLLPEAQLDRFLLHVDLRLPDAATERRILDLVEQEFLRPPHFFAHGPDDRATTAEITAARRAVMAVHLSPAIRDYIVRLVTAARAGTAPDIAGLIEHPPSPRGTLALAAAGKARAWLSGRDFVLPEDVADLAGDVLAHRMILTWKALADGATPRGVVSRLLDRVRPA